MPAVGKYSAPKPKPQDYADQKAGDAAAFNKPKRRPNPPKGGNHINPKVPNSKVGVYK